MFFKKYIIFNTIKYIVLSKPVNKRIYLLNVFKKFNI